MAPLIDTDDQRATKILDAAVQYSLKNPVSKTSSSPIVNPASTWTIEGVNYHGKIIPVTLSRELLPPMNLSQMQAHAREAKKTGEPYSANAPLVFAIAKRAMKLRHIEIKNFMRSAFFYIFPNTLSVVRYTPARRLDSIVHNPDLSNQYSSKLDFVAPDEFVRGSKRRKDYQALLGTNNPDEVADVFGWLTGKKAYAFKPYNTDRPQSVDERVVRLDTNSDRFDLGCDGSPQGARVSFGVRFA
ncbi:MAG: hypothetical protein AABX11_00830 [Nanoarchaeota archaeon]